MNVKTDEIGIRVEILDCGENKWGVVFQGENNAEESSIKMPSKEDAVRYARVCEQRTGRKVLLPE